MIFVLQHSHERGLQRGSETERPSDRFPVVDLEKAYSGISGLSAITDYGRLPDLEAVSDLDMVIAIMFDYPLPVFYALGRSSDLPATHFL